MNADPQPSFFLQFFSTGTCLAFWFCAVRYRNVLLCRWRGTWSLKRWMERKIPWIWGMFFHAHDTEKIYPTNTFKGSIQPVWIGLSLIPMRRSWLGPGFRIRIRMDPNYSNLGCWILIQESKNDPQKQKKVRVRFWNAGCSLLRAEGFFHSLDVLYGGQGISKLQFLIKTIELFFQL